MTEEELEICKELMENHIRFNNYSSLAIHKMYLRALTIEAR